MGKKREKAAKRELDAIGYLGKLSARRLIKVFGIKDEIN